MTRIEHRVTMLVARILGVAPEAVAARAASSPADDWDSIQHMHICLALEEEFGVRFDDEELSKVDGIQNILSTLRTRGVSGGEDDRLPGSPDSGPTAPGVCP